MLYLTRHGIETVETRHDHYVITFPQLFIYFYFTLVRRSCFVNVKLIAALNHFTACCIGYHCEGVLLPKKMAAINLHQFLTRSNMSSKIG